MSSLFNIFQFSNRYHLSGRLTGHTGAINSVAVSNDGNILASGGSDGLKLWDVGTMKELSAPHAGVGLRGTVSCIAWITREHEPGESLCYGTLHGYLVVWRRRSQACHFDEPFADRLATGNEITCLSWDTTREKLALGNRERCIQVWTFDNSYKPCSIFSIQLSMSVPKALFFSSRGDVMVFGLYDGKIITLRGNDGSIIGTQKVGGRIGSAAVSPRGSLFVTDDTAQGVALHEVESGARIRTFNIPITRPTVPKQVAFVEGSKYVVGGSDHGIVYVFNRKDGSISDKLQHCDAGRVQTLTTSDIGDVSRIITATSTESDKISIAVWTLKSRSIQQSRWSIDYFVVLAIQLVMVAATMVFIWQNYGEKLDIGPWLRRAAVKPLQGNDLSITSHLVNPKFTGKRFPDIDLLNVMANRIIQMADGDGWGGQAGHENVILL